ncbi:uncharacterized protein LOC120347359 [Styela clava]
MKDTNESLRDILPMSQTKGTYKKKVENKNHDFKEEQKYHHGKVVNEGDDGLKGWKTVMPHSHVRKQALARTASAPVKMPARKNVQKPLASSLSNSPSVSNRLIYDREALLSYRFSPHSMTPPKDLPEILEAIKPASKRSRRKKLGKTLSGLSNCSEISTSSDSEVKIPSDSDEKKID